jgi:hypothetical protein
MENLIKESKVKLQTICDQLLLDFMKGNQSTIDKALVNKKLNLFCQNVVKVLPIFN